MLMNEVLILLGHENCQSWVRQNLDVIFSDDGPLRSYLKLSVPIMMQHIRAAQDLAKASFSRNHSNDTTGAAQETIPEWVRLFRQLEREQDAAPSVSATTARACS